MKTENKSEIAESLQEMANIARNVGMAPDRINAVCDSYSELLAALKETLDALYNETAGKQDSPWIASVKAKAKDAIARVEGRAKFTQDEIDEAVLAGRITPEIREAQAKAKTWSRPKEKDDGTSLGRLNLYAKTTQQH